MALSWWVRIALAVLLGAAVLLAVRLHSAGGQSPALDGDALSGRRLVDAWCTECHSVERATAGKGTIAPDFTAIAGRRSTTAISLRAFLQSDHKTMPNFIIQPGDADAIIAYILSLRRR